MSPVSTRKKSIISYSGTEKKTLDFISNDSKKSLLFMPKIIKIPKDESNISKDSLLLPDSIPNLQQMCNKKKYRFLPIKLLPHQKYINFSTLVTSEILCETKNPFCSLCMKYIKNLNVPRKVCYTYHEMKFSQIYIKFLCYIRGIIGRNHKYNDNEPSYF